MSNIVSVDIVDHADGSATLNAAFSAKQLQAFTQAGIVGALEAGIRLGDEYNPDNVCGVHHVKLLSQQVEGISVDYLKALYYNCNLDYVRGAVATVLKHVLSAQEYEGWMSGN